MQILNLADYYQAPNVQRFILDAAKDECNAIAKSVLSDFSKIDECQRLMQIVGAVDSSLPAPGIDWGKDVHKSLNVGVMSIRWGWANSNYSSFYCNSKKERELNKFTQKLKHQTLQAMHTSEGWESACRFLQREARQINDNMEMCGKICVFIFVVMCVLIFAQGRTILARV